MYCSLKLVQAVVIILLLVTPLSLQCGPGRGSGRRRRPRKLTPLVFKQHVPNVSENTIGASGLSDGAITKEDPKFKDLVSNENPNIEFKDEERTGADRMMSEVRYSLVCHFNPFNEEKLTIFSNLILVHIKLFKRLGEI